MYTKLALNSCLYFLSTGVTDVHPHARLMGFFCFCFFLSLFANIFIGIETGWLIRYWVPIVRSVQAKLRTVSAVPSQTILYHIGNAYSSLPIAAVSQADLSVAT